MGRGIDKALLVVDGQPLARRTADVLAGAGAAEVLAIGGDGDGLRALGLDARPDHHPGEGPLGGILTALSEASHDIVVVVATDLAALTAAPVRAVVERVRTDATLDVALAVTERLEPLCGAWRRRALPALVTAWDGGARAVHAALGALVVARVPVDAVALRNVNRPGDLATGTGHHP